MTGRREDNAIRGLLVALPAALAGWAFLILGAVALVGLLGGA